MDLQLTDKTALVTGSSRGLGFASARALLDEGCSVAICARGRERLDAAIRLDPYHWEARLALGGWHADIAAEGFVARRMYGGNRPAAIVLFEQALQMAPESRVVLYEYAIRLPDLDEENGEERAREMLDTAARLPIVDAYDGLVQKLVREGIASREGG